MKPCNQCGKCCIAYSDGGLSTTAQEVEWWEVFRPEIARYVHEGNIWCDPETGEQLSRCPWLQAEVDSVPTKYGCTIYHDRPEDCRHYPIDLAQMSKDNCEMLEPQDLLHPNRAQQRLDDLMADSRPGNQG